MEVYAIPGRNISHICEAKNAPSNAILMNEFRPTINHKAQSDGTWLYDEQTDWKNEILEANSIMSAEIEEIWDYLGIENASIETQAKYQAKKEIRDKKPK